MKSMIKSISGAVVTVACLLSLLLVGFVEQAYALPPVCVTPERVMYIAKDGSTLTTAGEAIVILQDAIEPNVPRKATIRDLNGNVISFSRIKESDFIAVKGLHYTNMGGAPTITALEIILLPGAMSRDEMMKYPTLQPLCERKRPGARRSRNTR